MTTYFFKRDASPADWSPLPREFKKGEEIKRQGEPWGLCRDDAKSGYETVPCTIDGLRVFTVLCSLLQTKDGGLVCGDYDVPGEGWGREG